MTSKVEKELRYAKLLQRRCRRLAGRRLVPLDPPEPDVGATTGSSVIGIEVTEVHGNPRLRMTEAEQDRTLRLAESIWRERGLPAIGVAVQWRPTRVAQKYQRRLAEQLVDVVAATMPAARKVFEIADAKLSRVLGGYSPVEHVIACASDTGLTEWGGDRRWSPGQPHPSFFQEHINRKNSKPSGYRGAYDERWLLLVHHGARPSSGFDMPSNIRSAVFASTFDRVFLLGLTPYSVRALKTQAV